MQGGSVFSIRKCITIPAGSTAAQLDFLSVPALRVLQFWNTKLANGSCDSKQGCVPAGRRTLRPSVTALR